MSTPVAMRRHPTTAADEAVPRPAASAVVSDGLRELVRMMARADARRAIAELTRIQDDHQD